jgi:hypothetical protein
MGAAAIMAAAEKGSLKVARGQRGLMATFGTGAQPCATAARIMLLTADRLTHACVPMIVRAFWDD